MHDLNRIVVPKVSAGWEDIAYALQYEIPTVEQISESIKKTQPSAVKNCLRIGYQQIMVLSQRHGKLF